VLPLAAAKWSGVEPEVPTIGTEESRFLSFEYFRGNLSYELEVDLVPKLAINSPRSVDVGAMINQVLHNLDVPPSTGCM